MVSLYQDHVQRWTGCSKCALHDGRNKMCFARGSIPADILMIGQAPGESENVLGRPFCGPAGHLLDDIVKRSIPEGVRICYTNLVCCIPRNEYGGETEPVDVEIMACGERLRELVEMCQPSVIVCVGDLSRDWIQGNDKKGAYSILPDYEGEIIHIRHPAAILKARTDMKGLMKQKVEVTLRDMVEDLL